MSGEGKEKMKEIVGCALIIAVICIVSFKIESYLDNTSNELIEDLEKLKTQIKNKESNLNETANDIIKKWKEVCENWSTIVAHEELNLVMEAILELKSDAEENFYEDSLKEIDKIIFLINNIKEREALNIKNIF